MIKYLIDMQLRYAEGVFCLPQSSAELINALFLKTHIMNVEMSIVESCHVYFNVIL